jgi:hypothetical protein
MYRSTMKLALGAALVVPCLLLTACGPEASLDKSRPPVNPETALVPLHATIRKGYAWNAARMRMEPVKYAEVDGLAVVEGDMIIGTVKQMEARTREVESRGGPEAGSVRAQGVAINDIYARWPDAVVPYTLDPSLPDSSRVTGAISSWQQATHIRFVLRTSSNATQYPNYVTFRPHLSACSATVGNMTNGQQFVNLADGCDTGSTIHEIGHVLGLWHEQSREDRNQYVRILLENVEDGHAHNFEQHINYAGDLGAYDFGSIMHYSAYAFSKNGLPTIQTLGGQSIGNRTSLSSGDVASIKRIYSIDDSELFIQQTYQDVLKRTPDKNGFFYHLNQIKACNGAPACLASTRVAIARGMLESQENRQQDPELNPSSPGYNSAFITHCYTNFLRRQPDAAGHAWWLNTLNSGGDYSGVVNGFITSAEYRQRFGLQ